MLVGEQPWPTEPLPMANSVSGAALACCVIFMLVEMNFGRCPVWMRFSTFFVEMMALAIPFMLYLHGNLVELMHRLLAVFPSG